MALILQGYTLREAVGFSERKYNLVGAPVWDAEAWTDLDVLEASWPTSDLYPGDPRTCRAPTEAEVNAAVQEEVDRVAEEAASRVTDALNKINAEDLLEDADAAVVRLGSLVSGAQAGQTIDWAREGQVALIAHVRQVMPQVLAGIEELAKDGRGTIKALRLAIERELRNR